MAKNIKYLISFHHFRRKLCVSETTMHPETYIYVSSRMNCIIYYVFLLSDQTRVNFKAGGFMEH